MIYLLYDISLSICVSRFRKVLEKGSFFGEMGLLMNQPRTADVVTLSLVEVCILSKSDFDEVLVMYPEYAQSMVKKAKATARVDNRRAAKRLQSVGDDQEVSATSPYLPLSSQCPLVAHFGNVG
jgi:CRP-like cAMP-binding protein